jgi:hypothetical protein
MKKKKDLEKAIRMLKYMENSPKYDKAIKAVCGGLLALIDYYEDVNEILPEVFPSNLKYSIQDFLDNIYKGKDIDAGVSEEHNHVAELFRTFIKSLKNEQDTQKK